MHALKEMLPEVRGLFDQVETLIRETPTATTNRRPTIKDASAGYSNPGCPSKSTSDQDVSSSTVVGSQATSFFCVLINSV